jgi:DNA gyrase subunit A
VCGDEATIVLITQQARLLQFGAGLVRPQGLSAAGMAGISLGSDDQVIFAGIGEPLADVITVSGSSTVLPGTEAQRIKRTPLSEFPAKGRATGGVRAHSFLKGEDQLVNAFVGINPRALGQKGTAQEIPELPGKRDASGAALHHPIGFLGFAPISKP